MVSFIHNQDGGELSLVSAYKVGAEIQQQLALGFAFRWDTQVSSNIAQELLGSQTTIEDIRVSYALAIQQLEQAPNDQGLSCPNLTGHNNETFASLHAVVERGKGFVVPLSRKHERRVRRDLKWVPLQ